MNGKLFSAHLTERLGIVITWRPFSLSVIVNGGVVSLSFYILIFFSESILPIRTKISRNIHWMISFTVYMLIKSTQKKQEFQRFRNIYRYTLFIVHLFLIIIFYAFMWKIPFRKMHNVIM